MALFFFDVQYQDPSATAACGVAEQWTDTAPLAGYTATLPEIAPYEPGAFWKRELPCLLAVLAQAREHHTPELLVVDGYVWLAEGRPGLGAHLHEATGLPVVGIAKTAFVGCDTSPVIAGVLRGESRRPLYVSSAGWPLPAAADAVRQMAGEHRIPLLLQAVDHLARGRATAP